MLIFLMIKTFGYFCSLLLLATGGKVIGLVSCYKATKTVPCNIIFISMIGFILLCYPGKCFLIRQLMKTN